MSGAFGSGGGALSVDVTSPFALRLNPAMDLEGTPDAIWYIGLNRTYTASGRVGTGLCTLVLNFR